jgi:cysteinyl-tRNA synthetase
VNLRLYDTGTRTVRDFTPLVPGQVSVYLCGDTPQATAHIGHARSKLAVDVLRRWLEATGSAVTLVRNVTDIDDKILAIAAAAREPWWALESRNERTFEAAYDTIGVLPPTVTPRATGHVPQMISLMRRLVDAGHAYPAGGDVYFSVRSWPAYGELSGQQVTEMQQGEPTGAKRDPVDFALWKAVKPGEPAWETPWGPGRPGWHLECSAMSTFYLGPTFDIHGGGLDLIFPHHENEQAQSRAAGDGFSRYWFHNGLLTIGGDKMSKSLGNSLLVKDLIRRWRPIELRYYLTSVNYRSTMDYSEDAVGEAAAAFRRVEGFLARAADLVGDAAPGTLPDTFVNAMNDDLAVSPALAVVHGAVRDGNTALTAGDKAVAGERYGEVRAMLGALGLDPVAPQWADERRADLTAVVDSLVQVALEARQEARKRRDYQAADTIRARLTAAGISVEDTPAGPRWSLPGWAG